MSYHKTKLLRHPTVEKAYKLLDKKAGWRRAAGCIADATLYSQTAAMPDPDVAAALLLANYAFDEARKVNPQVAALADFAIDISWDSAPSMAEDPDRADIMLAKMAGMARYFTKEIERHPFYVFETMQRRIARIDDAAQKAARLSENPQLIAAAETAVVAMAAAQTQRIDKVRAASVFAASGLPAHPLIEKVYEAERYHDFQVNPHVMPLEFELEAVRVLMAELDRVEPEMIVAALLNQVFGDRADRIEYLYGARVAELYAETAPIIGLPAASELTVKGSADIRAAFGIAAVHRWIADCAHETSDYRLDLLCNIEEKAQQFHRLIATGALSPAMAKRLETEAKAAEAVVHAPENTAIRKPGTPRPERGW